MSGPVSLARSCNKARAAVASATQASAMSFGGMSPSASASPRGVGTQNCAGRTKANNSSRSNAAKPAQSLAQPFEGISSRRATARAWHTIGVSPPCTGSSRARASSGDNASTSPSGDSHNTSRNPATSAGTRGTRTRSSAASGTVFTRAPTQPASRRKPGPTHPRPSRLTSGSRLSPGRQTGRPAQACDTLGR